MEIDHKAAVATIGYRIMGDFEKWQKWLNTNKKTPVEGYDEMMVGISALRNFGYAKEYNMRGGKWILERLTEVHNSFPEQPYCDVNKVPTKQNVEEAQAWKKRVEAIILKEFAPEL